MKPNFQVKEKSIYSDQEPTPEEVAAGVIYQPEDDLPRPEMVNKEIEDPEEREKIPKGEGNICISIQPGEELGELTFNVQFEGRRGDYDFCVENHNELLLHVSDWIGELLSELGTDFDVFIDSKPCPKTEQRVEVDLAAQILEKKMSLTQARQEHQTRLGHSVEVTPRQQLETKVSRKV